MIDTSPFYVLRNMNIDFKESIRCRIENLLNTRCRFLGWPEQHKALEQSVISYGLPRFLSQELTSEQNKMQFCERIAKVISVHEPKLFDVKVKFVDDDIDESQEKFCFTITGFMSFTREIEPFLFNSYFKHESNDFHVS